MDYSFNTIEDKGFYPTMKNGTIDIFTKVCMLYDIYGDLINYMFINLDNTDKAVAYTVSRSLNISSAWSAVLQK